MSTLYNKIQELCEKRGVSGYRMCRDVGIQPSIITDLKMGRRSSMKAETAQKVAEYFDVTVGYLLGEETKKAPTQEGERIISDDDIKFALWGTKEIDDDVLDRVMQFARFAQENEKNK